MKTVFRVNNFDILRLIAALQVADNHTMVDLGVEYSSSFIPALTTLFPGVPIFFFVSGFLISRSYENNPVITEYAQNRILRIYPALIVCTFAAVISVYLSGYLSKVEVGAGEIFIWIFGQISILQFYNPDFMREFGSGVLNGPIWTIAVELQFYIAVPILYWMFGLAKPLRSNMKIVILILFFMMIHLAYYRFYEEFHNNIIFKIWGVSFLPWIYMFLVGTLFQRNYSTLSRLLSGKVLYLLPVYLIFAYISVNYFGWTMGNGINPVLFVLLASLLFSFAYSCPALSNNILKGNDISYGVYIYHIPVVNLLMYYGYVSNISYVFMAITITILLAIIFWLLIEKNSMKFKKHPLNPIKSANMKIDAVYSQETHSVSEHIKID